MSNILKVNNLSKSFEVESKAFQPKRYLKAVSDLSFEIKKGTTFSIVGESGCGKSTTGRLISRLIDSNEGEILFNGEDIAQKKERHLKDVRTKIQMIFQDPYASLNPRMTVQELIAEPLVIHYNLSKQEIAKRVKDILNVVGISSYHMSKYIHEFSGGQRQRIGIARALIMKPELIIADEPVSALDVSIQSQILNLLKDLQKEYNLTYLFISHDLSVVEYISDYIGVMYLGSMVEIGSKEEFFKNPKHPYTKALLDSVPVPNPLLRRERIILKGDIPSPVNPPSGCKFHTRCPIAEDICKVNVPILLNKGSDTEHRVACHLVE